jgi:hypothetical protein
MTTLTIRRLLSTIALAAVASGAAVAISAPPASAAASISACLAAVKSGAPIPVADAACTGAQIARHDGCWDPSVLLPGATFDTADLGFHFRTTLRWSSQCRSNFAVTEIIGIDTLHSPIYDFATKVRRYDGPDGPYVMQQSPWRSGGNVGDLAISPLVYSPDNPAQACFVTRANAQVNCTIKV